MKDSGWLYRTRPKRMPHLGNPYDVTGNKLDRDFQSEQSLEKLVKILTLCLILSTNWN